MLLRSPAGVAPATWIVADARPAIRFSPQWRVVLAALALIAPPLSGQSGARQAHVVQIGALDGDPAQVFSSVVDLDVAPDGSVFILDQMDQKLRWFDRDGHHRATVGREGRGPGEFLSPEVLTVTSDGRVHVVDNRNTCISVFRFHGSALEHEKEVRLPFPVGDVCAIGTRLFVLGVSQPKLIHELDEAGRVVRSFGEPVEPDEATKRGFAPAGLRRLRQAYNGGHLACDARSNRVYLAHGHFLVRAFSADGRQLWRTRLAGANLGTVTPVNGGRGLQTALDNGSGGSNGAGGIAVDAAGDVLVGVGTYHVRGGEVKLTYGERRLRSSDGREIGRAAARGMIEAMHDGLRYTLDPWTLPRVLIY